MTYVAIVRHISDDAKSKMAAMKLGGTRMSRTTSYNAHRLDYKTAEAKENNSTDTHCQLRLLPTMQLWDNTLSRNATYNTSPRHKMKRLGRTRTLKTCQTCTAGQTHIIASALAPQSFTIAQSAMRSHLTYHACLHRYYQDT